MSLVNSKSLLSAATLALAAAGSAQAAPAGWDAYVIRGGPVINENYNSNPNQVQFIVNGNDPNFGGSDKAGLGTNNMNGATIGQITQLSISRIDNYTRFPSESGPYVAPYMNFWVQDAQGDYGVLANEPSNAFEWTGTSEWNTTGSNLATKTVKVFEQEGDFDLPAGYTVGAGGIVSNGTNSATFADFAGYTISAPNAAFLGANEPTGSGAPREVLTNQAYGFNWVFGDTGGNYVSDTEGFIVGDPVAVPEPTGLALIALGGITLLGRRGRRAPRA